MIRGCWTENGEEIGGSGRFKNLWEQSVCGSVSNSWFDCLRRKKVTKGGSKVGSR